MKNKPRLPKAPAKAVAAYTSSLFVDKRLYRQDIAGSIAHARMLARQGIISEKDAELIVMGLSSIREEIEKDAFPFREELEDVHMNIEARLFGKIGDVAGKLHTARSRNDQVALDLRLYMKETIPQTIAHLKGMQKALLSLAEANKGVIMPGYTHLQPAQPVLLAHHLLAYFEMFQRDRERFADCLKRADAMPLGSGALAGVPYPIDREFLAKELGFSRISANSLDAVADRDFVLEYQAAAAIAMMHLSRLCEEIVLWASPAFGFVEIDSAYASGSSIMPQKRNPDVAELARARTGKVYGALLGLLTALKGLPLAYNRDLQEDKEALFATIDTLHASLEACAGMVATLKVDDERCRRAAEEGYTLATDVADYLAKKGMPFRQAHAVVSDLVKYAQDNKGKKLSQLSLEEYRHFSELFQRDVLGITIESSVAARDVPGGTAPKRVEAALRRAMERLEGS